MYTAIKGIYENGQVVLQEKPPTTKKSQVVIMFISEQESQLDKPFHKGVKIGSLAGKGYNIPDDFNEPLDDLKHI
jgi:uncharacterized protein (DUF2062 family)